MICAGFPIAIYVCENLEGDFDADAWRDKPGQEKMTTAYRFVKNNTRASET